MDITYNPTENVKKSKGNSVSIQNYRKYINTWTKIYFQLQLPIKIYYKQYNISDKYNEKTYNNTKSDTL